MHDIDVDDDVHEHAGDPPPPPIVAALRLERDVPALHTAFEYPSWNISHIPLLVVTWHVADMLTLAGYARVVHADPLLVHDMVGADTDVITSGYGLPHTLVPPEYDMHGSRLYAPDARHVDCVELWQSWNVNDVAPDWLFCASTWLPVVGTHPLPEQ